MHRSTIALALALGLLAAACAGETTNTTLPNHDTDATVISGIERIDGKGLYRAGSVERFRVLVAGSEPADVDVVWEASAGAVTMQGDEVLWTLPAPPSASLSVKVVRADGTEETADYSFAVSPPVTDALVSPAAQGPVDDSTDSTGSRCDLAIGTDDTPHVIFRNDTHPGLWYATWNGNTWQSELVDGMGFDVGAEIGGPMSLALGAGGVPHIAYVYDGSDGAELRYATKSGGTWVLENAEGTHPYYDYELSIALDPAHGNRPTIAYTYMDAVQQVAVSYRSGAGSWVSAADPGDGSNWRIASGGLAISSTGTAYISFQESENTSWDGNDRHGVILWSATGGFAGNDTVVEGYVSYDENARMALDGLGKPVMVHDRGVGHMIGGTWNHSDIETSTIAHFDIAFAGGKPVVGLLHSSALELVTPNARGYWIYTEVGSADSAWIGVAIDTTGVPHACYRNDYTINFF